ncbi:hypothetical protein ABTL12_20195, partial [Acinetobacter baumannii]
ERGAAVVQQRPELGTLLHPCDAGVRHREHADAGRLGKLGLRHHAEDATPPVGLGAAIAAAAGAAGSRGGRAGRVCAALDRHQRAPA